MDDLVVLRNLIRAVSVRDQSVEADAIFRRVAFESQPTLTPRRVSTVFSSNVLSRVPQVH